MKKRLLYYLLLIEFVVILVVAHNLYQKKTYVSVASSKITEIYQNIPSEKFKYYYEHYPDKTITEDMYGINAKYTINKDGFNDRYDYVIPKPEGVYRIITLGDSFTFGNFVNTKDNWTELLEDKLNNYCKNKVEVINFGVGGYDKAYAIEQFIRKGAKYQPDLVIWLDYSVFRDTERQKSLLRDYFDSNSVDAVSSKESDEIYDKVAKKFEDSDRNYDFQLNRYDNVLSTILRLSSIYSGKLMLVEFPTTEDLGKKLLHEASEKRQETYVMSKMRNIYELKAYIPNDGHPNLKGHRMISEDILNYLLEKKLVNCTY